MFSFWLFLSLLIFLINFLYISYFRSIGTVTFIFPLLYFVVFDYGVNLFQFYVVALTSINEQSSLAGGEVC